MQFLNQFVINFIGLKEGLHEFEFDLDNTFFEHFDYNDPISLKNVVKKFTSKYARTEDTHQDKLFAEIPKEIQYELSKRKNKSGLEEKESRGIENEKKI